MPRYAKNKMNHYSFLDKHLAEIWLKVRGTTLDEDWCAGIIVAHGDKCYGYRDKWEKAGIHFNVGALIYLFSYVSPRPNNYVQLELLEQDQRHTVGDWVIRQYNNEDFIKIIKKICEDYGDEFPQVESK